jgi:hypothetical protein
MRTNRSLHTNHVKYIQSGHSIHFNQHRRCPSMTRFVYDGKSGYKAHHCNSFKSCQILESYGFQLSASRNLEDLSGFRSWRRTQGASTMPFGLLSSSWEQNSQERPEIIGTRLTLIVSGISSRYLSLLTFTYVIDRHLSCFFCSSRYSLNRDSISEMCCRQATLDKHTARRARGKGPGHKSLQRSVRAPVQWAVRYFCVSLRSMRYVPSYASRGMCQGKDVAALLTTVLVCILCPINCPAKGFQTRERGVLHLKHGANESFHCRAKV